MDAAIQEQCVSAWCTVVRFTSAVLLNSAQKTHSRVKNTAIY